MRRWAALSSLLLVAVAASSARAGTGSGLAITEVGREPFPQRGFIVDLPREVPAANLRPEVRENGLPVPGVTITPIGSSDVRQGTVLAIDASESMTGAPLRSAIAAAKEFVRKRPPGSLVAVITFNGTVSVHSPLTTEADRLSAALSSVPKVAYGTRVYDAIDRSLDLLEGAGVSAGSIVVLSDGTDVGSRAKLTSVIARAQRDHARVFSVGLKSGAFDPKPLRLIGLRTNGGYAEAATAPALQGIYSTLGSRLASEYLVQYRSQARPGVDVGVAISFPGVGSGSATYTAPTGANLEPFHRSLVTRFFLSAASLVLLSLLAAALAGAILVLLLNRPRGGLVERIGGFVGFGTQEQAEALDDKARRRELRRRARTSTEGWLRRLENEFEIGNIDTPVRTFVMGTAAVTVLLFAVLAAVILPLSLLAVLVPIGARAWVIRKVKAVRDAFADQLPETLQLLASALRSGHSLIGAMNVVVERAPEPIKREFTQVLTDDQLGIPLEQSLRAIARRMKSRDMEQVGLLGELQRTVGGNSAEVLDTVVETVRERADVRRLARTMTAQGRLARWILSILPIVLGFLMLALSPKLMKPMLTSGGGQLALVIAAIFAIVGSLWIKKIVEIEV